MRQQEVEMDGLPITININIGCKPRSKHQSTFRWFLNRQSFVESQMARLTNEQEVSVTVVAKTAAGREAPIDGEVEFTSSDETVAVVVKTGPQSAVVKAVAPGAAQIVAVFDADLGDGVRPIELSGAVEVVRAEAEIGVLTFGAPTLQPA